MEVIPQKQPARDLPWTLETARKGKTSQVTWEAIEQELDRLGPSSDSFVILEQKKGEDYWFIQSAVALKGPHAGQYIVGCGWSDPEGPAMVETYCDEAEALALFRTVWEGRELDFSGFADLSGELLANQEKQLLRITRLEVGPLGTNCYILTEKKAKLAAIVDPGGNARRIQAEIEKQGVKVQYILLTHGHYDHTDAVPALAKVYPEAEIYIHKKDYPGPDPGLFPLYGQLGGEDCPQIRYYQAFNDRDVPMEEARQLPLGELLIHPIHTWGHSDGSVSLRVSGGPIFCGDTLFEGSCGRTDFPGGNVEKMMSSLRLFGWMEGDAAIYPGHMQPTSLEAERKQNPYLRHAMQQTP